MPNEKDRPKPDFGERSPAFLSLLDRDPERALTELYEYVQRFFATRPPSVYFGISVSDREDWPSKLFFHLIEDRCRRLKKYRVQDTTFAAWLAVVARNLIVSSFPKRPPPEELPVDLAGPVRGSLDPATEVVLHRCLGRLSERCRSLVETSAQGLTPVDICVLWGLDPERHAIPVSAARTGCLRTLRRYLEEEGYVPAKSSKKSTRPSEKGGEPSLSECREPYPASSVGAGVEPPESKDVP